MHPPWIRHWSSSEDQTVEAIAEDTTSAVGKVTSMHVAIGNTRCVHLYWKESNTGIFQDLLQSAFLYRGTSNFIQKHLQLLQTEGTTLQKLQTTCSKELGVWGRIRYWSRGHLFVCRPCGHIVLCAFLSGTGSYSVQCIITLLLFCARYKCLNRQQHTASSVRH